jgi:hypothetical protein
MDAIELKSNPQAISSVPPDRKTRCSLPPRPSALGFKSPRRLRWNGDALYLDGKGRAIVRIVPEETYSGMWRVSFDGRLSDMVNLTRAKDAAVVIACQTLGAP